MDCSTPGTLSISNSQSLLNSSPLSWWCHPTISSSVVHFSPLPSIFPSIRIFSNESVLHIRWPKYWSFSFSSSPSNEYSGLISFRMDWLDLLAVQGTLKSLLQRHSSKASVLWRSAFFIVQLSHPYMTTGKTIALTRWTFVGKVMSLLFNFMTAVTIYNDFGPPKTVFHCFHCFPIYLPWSDGTGCHDLSFRNVEFSHSSLTFIKRLLGSSSPSAVRVVSSAYLRLLILLPEILIPASVDTN